MEAALIGLTGVLIAQLVIIRFKLKERRDAQFAALAVFLEKTAECLDAMREKLGSYEVPKGLGTRLREHIAEYELVIRSSTLSSGSKASLRTVVAKVRQLLTEGQMEDDVLEGKILRASETKRLKLLDDLKRAAELLRGQADSLRARVA